MGIEGELKKAACVVKVLHWVYVLAWVLFLALRDVLWLQASRWV